MFFPILANKLEKSPAVNEVKLKYKWVKQA
jgi:hypothetical protein